MQTMYENEIRILKANSSSKLKVLKENAKAEKIQMEIEIAKLNDEVSSKK